MSGPIRTTLGPTLGRVRGYIQTTMALLNVADDGELDRAQLRTLRQQRLLMTRAVDQVDVLNGRWTQLIAAIVDEQARAAEDHYRRRIRKCWYNSSHVGT